LAWSKSAYRFDYQELYQRVKNAMAVIYLDPATPNKSIKAKSGLLFCKDTNPNINRAPTTVREALQQMQKRFSMPEEGDYELMCAEKWGGVDTDSNIFVIGSAKQEYPSTGSSYLFRERQYFGIGGLLGNLTRLWSNHVDQTGSKNASFAYLRYTDLLYIQNGKYLYNLGCFRIQKPDKTRWGNIQYMNPFGNFEFFPAFEITSQWRRKRNDRPLELFEVVTTEPNEYVMTVGIPREAIRGMYRSTKFIEEMLHSYVAYWAFDNDPCHWVRIALLNKEMKIDFEKAYITVQFVFVRDIGPIDTRDEFFKEDIKK